MQYFIFKEGYIRTSSEEFDLSDVSPSLTSFLLDQSIHPPNEQLCSRTQQELPESRMRELDVF
jgi:hypothetical protein